MSKFYAPECLLTLKWSFKLAGCDIYIYIIYTLMVISWLESFLGHMSYVGKLSQHITWGIWAKFCSEHPKYCCWEVRKTYHLLPPRRLNMGLSRCSIWTLDLFYMFLRYSLFSKKATWTQFEDPNTPTIYPMRSHQLVMLHVWTRMGICSSMPSGNLT